MVAGVLPYLAKQGVDPADLTLLVYGGAGAIQGPLLAAELGINRVLVPQNALRLLRTRRPRLGTQPRQYGDRSWHGNRRGTDRIESSLLCAPMPSNGCRDRSRASTWSPPTSNAGRRCATSAILSGGRPAPEKAVEKGDLNAMEAVFHNEHERIYSHCDRRAPVEFVNLRIRVAAAC